MKMGPIKPPTDPDDLPNEGGSEDIQ